MPTFPPDRFDEAPADLHRVGAHRAPKRRGRGWIAFAWAALATGLIVAISVVGMFIINDNVSFENPFGGASTPIPTETPIPTIEPTVDPAANVVVLNGTLTDGLANSVGDLLVSRGWTVATRGNASASDVATTTVYYSDPSQEGAAKGIIQSLGVGSIALSDAFVVPDQVRLVVVVGADYPLPQ
ncbi:LytR C-terminal domain-containing protein [Amnibacterium flavum]|uniref:LytR/CpsA/Psr regulator C-terminal domain-containing protein n=1 Tax=Amnibacterium flavum TaxID=2173173 RepID=A0A2V1HL33_9MICO|nr:LytR C-terminal domain-containing protein [Amnibacterium flavum]PVZ93333.1 hypothetical protein DDQ50_15240 [Amnibacterium flavum]